MARLEAEDQLEASVILQHQLRITYVVFHSSLDLAGVSDSELIPFSM